jgi:hypothetical protein
MITRNTHLSTIVPGSGTMRSRKGIRRVLSAGGGKLLGCHRQKDTLARNPFGCSHRHSSIVP